MRRRNSNNLLVILSLSALVGLIVWLVSKQRSQAQLPSQEVLYLPPSTVPSAQPSTALLPAAMTSYLNSEEWEIQYSEDGLPIKVVVHRNAQRAR